MYKHKDQVNYDHLKHLFHKFIIIIILVHQKIIKIIAYFSYKTLFERRKIYAQHNKNFCWMIFKQIFWCEWILWNYFNEMLWKILQYGIPIFQTFRIYMRWERENIVIFEWKAARNKKSFVFCGELLYFATLRVFL